ncbi:MAG TPA: ABC transporter ATP-binding protein [Syntrophales bacterium]|nr:ABC transporter ATP-binding protein [Syntrophales bacterium]
MIEIKRLYKSYDKKPVLQDVNLSVRRGSIMGLLGPNGAGKTTLISILTGIIKKDGGSITIGGRDFDHELSSIQLKCSYVPQTLAFYSRLTGCENLEYFGALWGLKGRKLKERMEFCIDTGNMQAFVNKRVDKYSGGMKRRLNLVIGLLNDPEVLYLDEPTVGVDTQSRSYILETIKKINREKDITIIYTSHYMDEIEHVSDDIAVIDEGKIILHDSKEAILTHTDTALISVEEMGEEAIRELQQIDGIQVEKDCVHVKRDGQFNENMAAIFTILRNRGIQVKDAVFGHRTLEEFFLKLTNISLRDKD